MLTENEVQRSIQKMFRSESINESTLERAEALLDELRPESPLRFKLSQEIEELRKIHLANASS